tara:strand:- start:745 stop:969 length:225 start_codon:yes stop_codon:yes gene_type:complete
MQDRFLLIGDSMQTPNLHSTYSVETKDTKIMKTNLNDALNVATDMQLNGKDVEVYKDGFLKHKLQGMQQYSLPI